MNKVIRLIESDFSGQSLIIKSNHDTLICKLKSKQQKLIENISHFAAEFEYLTKNKIDYSTFMRKLFRRYYDQYPQLYLNVIQLTAITNIITCIKNTKLLTIKYETFID